MGCYNNIYSKSVEQIIDSFFLYLPIRSVNPLTYSKFIEKKIEEIDENFSNIDQIHTDIINEFLINKYYPDLSEKIFSNFLKNSNSNTKENFILLLISYLFLCSECNESAYEICKKLLSYIQQNNENTTLDMIDLYLIKMIVYQYVNLISCHSSKIINLSNQEFLTRNVDNTYKDDSKSLENTNKDKNYLENENAINLYIEHHFLSNVLSKKITLKKFFNRNYDKLTKDSMIRKSLKEIHSSLENDEPKGKRKTVYLNSISTKLN